MEKRIKNVSFLLFVMVLMVGSVVFFVGRAGSGYSDIMRRANSGNPKFGDSKVYDIAMLGSHDAMTHEIGNGSEVDYDSEVPDLGDLLKLNLVKSIIVNYSRAQSASLSDQLKAGARYIDARITCKDGVFRTTHGLLSGTLESYLKQLVTFLLDNPGEFVIFHIAQYNTTEKNENNLAEFMKTVTVRRNGKDYSIYDFVNYDTKKDFSEVTYNDVTKNGRCGGVIIISKLFGADKVSDISVGDYFKKKEYYSTWYNKSDPDELLSMIDSAVENYKGKAAFRINGFQTTPNAKSIALNLFGSLIKNAQSENIGIIEHPGFDYWLSCMPIVCFDEVVSTKGNFNARVNEKILNYNLNLNNTVEESKYKKITSPSQLRDGMKIVIKQMNSTDGYWGNDFKADKVGKYIAGEFILEDNPDSMWTLKQSGDGWKIKMPSGRYLDRSLFGYLVTNKKESSAVTFKFDFRDSGVVRVHYDKYYMYLTGKRVLDLSKKYRDEFEIYA